MEQLGGAGRVVVEQEGLEVVFADSGGRVRQLSWEQAVVSVRFEELGPVSAFPVVPGRRWGPGWWWSATTGRHVVHGSAAMRTQLMVLDREPEVAGLAGRPVRGGTRRTAGCVRGCRRCSPGTPTAPGCSRTVRRARPRAARGRCGLRRCWRRRARGWGGRYRRLGPPSAVVAANLRWLAGYRHPRYRGTPGLQDSVAGAYAVSRPLLNRAASVGDPLQVLPVVYHALWCGQLVTDLNEPLHGGSLVGVSAGGGPGGVRMAGAGLRESR
ncbi:TnsA-like heteromeric transposase endonuclease subunit [Streptomyces sp. NBC_00984]|uniref:TnsA-like heteromeric transposase endonuclease subunit n=1 Tax=Streptomyces sp. NBC_00984 TaxID=2903700 RepID=UPI00386BBAC0|nr:TnsA-like heteromeric transposase endonuclease subunit [Streptomyces sp. NBC_00984]